MLSLLSLALILFIVITIGTTLYVGIYLIMDGERIHGTLIIVIGVLLSIIIAVVSKSAIDDTYKSKPSSDVIYSVKVYDSNGKILEEYEGECTINDDVIIIEDKYGEHIIYNTSGTVVIEKVEENE